MHQTSMRPLLEALWSEHAQVNPSSQVVHRQTIARSQEGVKQTKALPRDLAAALACFKTVRPSNLSEIPICE